MPDYLDFGQFGETGNIAPEKLPGQQPLRLQLRDIALRERTASPPR
jgi:hypothetical protein